MEVETNDQNGLALVIDLKNLPNKNEQSTHDSGLHCITGEAINHNEILDLLIEQIEPVDFREEALFVDEKDRLGKKHYVVICIEIILAKANSNKWGICKNHDFCYLYNGAYWQLLDDDKMQSFLGTAALKMGVEKFDAKHFVFKRDLYKQFLCDATLPRPQGKQGVVLINMLNGTFEITPEMQSLRPHHREDFITYLLPFSYDPLATSPLFQGYLDKVQPDKERQDILAEYLAYLFVPTTTLKLEKALLLYGTGANGKSVFFEIVNALLGEENVSSFSLQTLTDIERGGPYRAKIANKLVNYASEINGKLETSIFKAMVSGEPIEAKALYSQPFQITNYAKLIFNCNQLPKEVEQTNAFFRRFLIVPFDVTIPDEDQDRQLPQKIIQTELSGVFNWVMSGLQRLMLQKRFTHSDAVKMQLEQYKKQSDSVQMFLEDEGYKKSINPTPLKDCFDSYRAYCTDYGYHAGSLKTFSERLKNKGFLTERKSAGMVVFIKKELWVSSDALKEQFKV